jgi:hypothetical protein
MRKLSFGSTILFVLVAWFLGLYNNVIAKDVVITATGAVGDGKLFRKNIGGNLQ